MRNVLQLYVDVEHTGRNAEFVEKFEQRERMGELLSAPSASPLILHQCFAALDALLISGSLRRVCVLNKRTRVLVRTS